jgi:hypothetical protein
VAPPGNQAATENTNINLYHSENPVYSPKVSPFKCGLVIAECGIQNNKNGMEHPPAQFLLAPRTSSAKGIT